MNLYILKYLFLLILEGEITSKELAEKLGEAPCNASHAMSILHKLGVISHPKNRVRSWIVDSSNPLVLTMEKLLIISKNNSEIKNLFHFPSVILIGNWFFINKKGATINELVKKTGLSRAYVMKALDKMSSENIINKKTGKPNNYYPYDTLLSRLFFQVSHDVLNLFSIRNDKKLSLMEIIRKIKDDESVLILIHYGSSYRGKDDRFSDIDLFVVTRDRISRGEILSRYSQKKLDLSVYSKRSFLELLRKQPDFMAHIATANVLKGKDIIEAII